MNDQEEDKTPWYATEFMGQIYVLFVLSLVFLAFMGWYGFFRLLLEQMIPFALLAVLITRFSKRLRNDDRDIWILVFVVLMGLWVFVGELLGWDNYILEGFFFKA